MDQLITEPTRITNNTQSLIDLCLTNIPSKIIKSGVNHISMSLGNGRVSRVEGHRSRVEGHKSRVEGHRSRVESRGRGSKVEVEGQKSRSRVKSRGRGSKVEVEGQKSRVESRKY